MVADAIEQIKTTNEEIKVEIRAGKSKPVIPAIDRIASVEVYSASGSEITVWKNNIVKVPDTEEEEVEGSNLIRERRAMMDGVRLGHKALINLKLQTPFYDQISNILL